MRTSVQIIRALAALYKRFGYHVSGIVRDPAFADRPYLFYVDNAEFFDRDGLTVPTSVRLFPASREVKFDGQLASELEALLEHVTRLMR